MMPGYHKFYNDAIIFLLHYSKDMIPDQAYTFDVTECTGFIISKSQTSVKMKIPEATSEEYFKVKF
jgi:hypothetical protein